jgi:hypothetical protein
MHAAAVPNPKSVNMMGCIGHFVTNLLNTGAGGIYGIGVRGSGNKA